MEEDLEKAVNEATQKADEQIEQIEKEKQNVEDREEDKEEYQEQEQEQVQQEEEREEEQQETVIEQAGTRPKPVTERREIKEIAYTLGFRQKLEEPDLLWKRIEKGVIAIIDFRKSDKGNRYGFDRKKRVNGEEIEGNPKFADLTKFKELRDDSEKAKQFLANMAEERRDQIEQKSEEKVTEKNMMIQHEKIDEVECNGVRYTVYKSSISEGTYLIEGGEEAYKIVPSELKCTCYGRTYQGRCKHLYHPNFIDLWTKLGEMKTPANEGEKRLVSVIEGLVTEDKAANIIRQVLGDVKKTSVIIDVPTVGEMLKADAVIALGNALGIKRENLENTPTIENIETDSEEGPIQVVRSKVRASYPHPSGVILESDATVLQKLDLDNLKGKRGTDLTFRAVQSKSERKAILRVLPITHNGLLAKIKKIYGWV